MSKSTMYNLVSNQNGIYSYYILAKNYRLFLATGYADGKPLYTEYNEDKAKKDFHPDNEQWCDSIDWAENYGLSIKDEDGSFWRVESIEGDIYAINPNAEWDEDEDAYILKDELPC